MFSPVVVRMPSSDEMLGSSSSPLTITEAHQEWIKQIKDGSLPRDAGAMPTTPRPLQVPFNRTARLGVSIAYLDTNTKYVKNLRVTDVMQRRVMLRFSLTWRRKEKVYARVHVCPSSFALRVTHHHGMSLFALPNNDEHHHRDLRYYEWLKWSQLVETHGRKLHIVLVDESLKWYHHVHPSPRDTTDDDDVFYVDITFPVS